MFEWGSAVDTSQQQRRRRSPRNHLWGIYSLLGKAAQAGGQKQFLREASSDRFADIFRERLDAETRKKAFEAVARIGSTAPATAPNRPMPKRDDRVKVRWSDDLVARFRFRAPHFPHSADGNRRLARDLGYPAYCFEAMRHARKRFLESAHASANARSGPSEAVLATLPFAA